MKLTCGQQERSISDAFAQDVSNTLVDMMQLDLLVGSGGVLSHAPRRSQSMLITIDAFQSRASPRSPGHGASGR